VPLLTGLILPMFCCVRMSKTNCARLPKALIQLQDAKPVNLILSLELAHKLQALNFLRIGEDAHDRALTQLDIGTHRHP